MIAFREVPVIAATLLKRSLLRLVALPERLPFP
jgi:hypothetical protein